jgi:hypothetical protein
MKKLIALALLSVAAVACGSSHGASADGSESDVTASDETCTATFHWLQKDAYKNTGGRSTALWPPHTTTTLEVHCADASGKETFSTNTFKENHGTKPGQVDANGKPFLVETKKADAKGTREQIAKLVDAYQSCGCDASTQFLSMDLVKDDLSSKKILLAFATYAEKHLTCTGDTTPQDVLLMIQNDEFEQAATAIAGCTWAAGYSFEDGMKTAAAGVLPDLSKFHVCNNDAKLEAALFSQFTADGTAPACDATADTCKGPAFFYTP